MIGLYVFQLVLTAAALAATAAAHPGVFGRLPTGTRVAVAISLTPGLLALEVLVIAWLRPGAPAASFLLLPAVLAGCVLAALAWRPGNRSQLRPLRGLEIVGSAILGLAVLAALVAGFRAAAAPATAHDVLIYLTEAKAFAAHPSLGSIPTFEAHPGQIIKTHPHQFLFQAYIAQGLMASGNGLGYPNDWMARFAIQLPLALLMLGVFGLARAALPVWTAAIAAPLMLLFDHTDYVSIASSTDAFRLAPFLAFLTLVLSCLGRRCRPSMGQLLLIGALGGVSAAAHTLNIIFLTLVGVAMIVIAAGAATSWANLYRLGLASAPFMALGVADYVRNWVSYGHPLGRGMYYFFYAGTPLRAAFARHEAWMRSTDPLRAFLLFALLTGLALTVLATVSAIILATRNRTLWRGRPAALGIVFLVAVWIPLMPGIGLQGAMLSNFRYGLVACALAACVIAVICGLALKWALASSDPARPGRFAILAALGVAMPLTGILTWMRVWDADWPIIASAAKTLRHVIGDSPFLHHPYAGLRAGVLIGALLGPAIFAGLSFGVWRVIIPTLRFRLFAGVLVVSVAVAPIGAAVVKSLLWRFESPAAAQARLNEGNLAIAELARTLPESANWIVDDYGVSYYAARPPLFFYSETGAPILRATTREQAMSRLRSARIGMVALSDPRSDWWPETQLYMALMSAGDVEKRSVGPWRVFLLPRYDQDGG